MNRKLFNEISNTHLFEMEHGAFMNQASLFLTHYRNMEDAGSVDDESNESFLLTAKTGFSEKVYIGDVGYISSWEDVDDSDVLINVIRMSGPLMRNSVCTYGSIELRRRIMEAADCKQCIGQIFIVDTPGGSSAAKFDLLEAMNYAKAKGQTLVMYVDGMVCSAGMAWAAMCHKRYARQEHCIFGCMGTFASFYTNQDKDVNSITQTMFHEVYATGSSLKNRAERDAAQGDNALIQQEVDKGQEQYRQIILQGIPQATEEQLQGKVYEASEVIGTLCDGMRTFQEVVDEMLSSGGYRMSAPEGGLKASAESGTFESLKEYSPDAHTWQASSKNQPAVSDKSELDDPDDDDSDDDSDDDPDNPGNPNQPVDPNDPDQDDDSDSEEEQSEHEESKTFKESDKVMSKKYEKIQQALEVESLESNRDNSLWLHEELADKLESSLLEKEKAEMALQSKAEEIKNLNGKIKQLSEDHHQELENQRKQVESEEAGKAEQEAVKLQKTIDGLQNQITSLTQERDDFKARLEKAEKDVEELSNEPSPQNQPEVPAGRESQTIQSSLPHRFDTVSEQRQAKLKFMERISALKK